MAKFSVFCTVVALAVASSFAQLVETGRECGRVPCAVDGETIALSCGINGERISGILFASYGTPTGTCPEEGVATLPASAYNFTNTTDCSLTDSIDIASECLNKETCTLNVTALTAGNSEGLSGCGGAELEFAVVVTCADPFNTLGILTVGVTAIIGLALGATVTIERFKETFTLHRRAVLVGWACQFGFMPLIAYIYCVSFDVEPLVALGAILTGSVPGGTTSNLLTYYAKGNVALSITMSVASTFCALFMVPFLVWFYFNIALGNQDTTVEPPFVDIILALFIVIIPVSFGVLIREKNEKWAKRVEIFGSILGALFLVAAVATGVSDNPDLFVPSEFPKTWIGAALFQPVATVCGFAVATLARLSGPELRAVVLETGVQNYTIAIAVAAISFTGCERTAVLTFILAASFWYVINSVWITAVLRFVHAKYDTPDEKVDEKEMELDAVVGA